METQEVMNVAGLTFKAATTELVKLSKQPVGFIFVGKFTGTRERDAKDSETGEPIVVTDYTFTWENKLLAIPQDKGLTMAFSDAAVNEGDIIQITKLMPVELKNSKRCNQYSIAKAVN